MRRKNTRTALESRFAPLLEVLEPRLVLDSTVVFNEILYHPVADESLEWVELYNQMAVDMDLSGWRIDGIRYEFPQGTVVDGGQYVVVAKSPDALLAATGLSGALGPYDGQLSNGGERLQLVNNSDRIMDEIDYDDALPWPVGADGSGASLAKLDANSASGPHENWSTSILVGGNPGQPNFVDEPLTGPTISLLDVGTAWRFDDRDRDYGTEWLAADFEPDDPDDDGNGDDAWGIGPGPFGADDAELPVAIRTPLEVEPTTHYFRTEFAFSGKPDSTRLQLDPIVDDGAVFYLNGREVARVNMPDGPIDHTTPAVSSVRSPDFAGPTTIAAADLVAGMNVLGVAVHQAETGSPPNIGPPPADAGAQGPGLTLVEEGPAVAEPGGPAPVNLATGATAFALDELGLGTYLISNVNDGRYGEHRSWIGDRATGVDGPFIGINLGIAPVSNVQSIAFGRSNVRANDSCPGGVCTNRTEGSYTVQYTQVPNPDQTLVTTEDASTGWVTVDTLDYAGPEGPYFNLPHLRHRFNFPPVDATGVRLIVPEVGIFQGTAIDELELYSQPLVPSLDLTLAESGGSFAAGNLAAQAAGAMAFARDIVADGDLPAHQIAHLNDHNYGNASSWIGESSSTFAGVRLASAQTIQSIAWSRDNTGTTSDRTEGTYWLQYTTVTQPDEDTPDSQWNTVGTVTLSGRSADAVRHRYNFRPIPDVTGVRLLVPNGGSVAGTAIDEIEVYGEPYVAELDGLTLLPQYGFSVDWDGNDGDYFDASADAPVPENLALATNGATAFASSELGRGLHFTPTVNDGRYGDSFSWIGANGDADVFVGLDFGAAVTIDRVAWSRDNGRLNPPAADEACGGQCADRSLGTYTLQYTTVSSPGEDTPDTGHSATGWQTIADFVYESSVDDVLGGGFTSYLRHEYAVRENGAPIEATGIRLRVPESGFRSGTAIDELEVYAPDLPDVVFGAQLTATELLPDPQSLVINELAAAASEEFWLEIANHGQRPVDLEGYVVASSDEDTAAAVLPPQVLPPDELLTLGESELGFRPSSGQRLFLYGPGRSTVLDAVVVEDALRGRSREFDGQWLYPVVPTPGTENRFSFTRDVVINEIMYNAGTSPAVMGTSPQYVERTLLPFGTSWRYSKNLIFSGNELPYDPGPNWEEIGHTVDNVNWLEGQAPLGSDRDRLPHRINTPFADPLTNRSYITTYYFETDFGLAAEQIADVDELLLSHLVDDGAVFYINGWEVSRFNMPDEVPRVDTLASSAVVNAKVSSFEVIPKDGLVALPEVNRLSVEVHQNSTLSDDIVFDLELVGRQLVDPGSPAVPPIESEEEWIELYNRSLTETIDLSGWTLEDAVQFRFPEGSTLGPQQYLVIARDAVTMRQKYPELDTVIGSFGGQLSNRHERIGLLDSRGNPADEVFYYDSGRWAEYADGGGSSLELRDPFADNAQPEAWAASDETTRSTWNTYSYRAVAASDGFTNGVTERYHEFIFGLLDAGELLIDDISVIEDPNGLPTQRIQNGTFDQDAVGGEADKWRIGGNHKGVVVVDPDDSQNQALRLTATGALEDRLNHAETTLVDNARIRDDVEYEISFRAKWLGGSNQLNTHLYFNRAARTTLLQQPDLFGTPGQQNSTLAGDIGPTYQGLAHRPVVPDPHQSVTVSLTADDAQGVTAMTLWYSVNEGPLRSVSMQNTEGQRYEGTIPGQPAAAVVQFYVEGTDGAGSISTFPAAGPNSRALYKVQDGQAQDGPLHQLRIIMMPSDTALLHTRTNQMSNDRLGATIVYNEQEVFYDAGVRLKGSIAGRANDAYLSFNVRFDPMHLFRGVHESVAIDRSGRSGPVPLAQDEILIKHITNHAGGVPGMYDDLVRVIAPNPRHTRTALVMMARYNDVFLDSQYENGSDGTVFKLDIAYVPNRTTNGQPESPKVPYPYSHPQPTKDLQDLGDDKEAYRPHLLIRNNRAADDYRRIIEVSKALSLRGDELAQAAEALIDVDEWARVFAIQSLTGAADVYTRGGLHHNIDFYVRPEDNRVLTMQWDWDFAFTASASQSLIGTASNTGRLLNLPGNRRLYYGHLLDIINTTFNNEYMDQWIDHYGTVAGQNFQPIKRYITSRRDYVLSRLPETIPFEITTNGGAGFTASEPQVVLRGQGWIDVRQLQLAGREEPLEVRWLDDETWEATIQLSDGANLLQLEAFNHQGQPVGADSITVFADRSVPQPGDANLDRQFDQQDIVLVLQGGKYLTGQPADFAEGDWNGDGTFNQSDIVAALQTGNYLQGPYAAQRLESDPGSAVPRQDHPTTARSGL